MMQPGARLTLDIEKPAAGGRMLARHAGQVMLVGGTIPGERVRAVVERVGKGVAFADTVEVLSASPDRRPALADWRCGGNVFSHIAYPRQIQIKADIIRDAFTRIAKLPLSVAPDVVGSPETGYRMRARFHVQGGRIGFFREGTHEICDAGATGQLLRSTVDWIARLNELLRSSKNSRVDLHGPPVTAVEIAENIPGDQRAVHLELQPGADPAPFAAFTGADTTTDTIHVRSGDDAPTLTLTRNVRAFFQSNRYLLETLVERVTTRAGTGTVVDLYAGVGLFGLSLAALGAEAVTLVEGDPISSADLVHNAEPFGARAVVRRQSVESFLSHPPASLRRAGLTCVVDPPRTGMTREALAGIINLEPSRIVYVSCDVATLARDARTLVDAGYELADLTGTDLFPNTSHVESIAVFRQ
jgi:23S rRNA (uracil1939-C5)-methyltransferase